MLLAVGQAVAVVTHHHDVVLHRHGLRVRVLGQVGPQVHVHLAAGLHLGAVGVLKVDVHGQHAVVGHHFLGALQGLLRQDVVLAALVVQLRHQLGAVRHAAVRIVHPDGDQPAALHLQHCLVVRRALRRVAALHGDGGQDEHVGGHEDHHRRHAGKRTPPAPVPAVLPKQLDSLGRQSVFHWRYLSFRFTHFSHFSADARLRGQMQKVSRPTTCSSDTHPTARSRLSTETER